MLEMIRGMPSPVRLTIFSDKYPAKFDLSGFDFAGRLSRLFTDIVIPEAVRADVGKLNHEISPHS
jgi:hypothetical protein